MWMRWNDTTHIFEMSTNDGASWAVLPLNASVINEGTINLSRLPTPITGDWKITGDFYEKSRTLALGSWIDLPFNATDYYSPTAGCGWAVTSATYAYTIIGKTVITDFVIGGTGTNTVTGNPIRLRIKLPANLYSQGRPHANVFSYYGPAVGVGVCTISGTTEIDLLRDVGGTPFLPGSYFIYGSMFHSLP